MDFPRETPPGYTRLIRQPAKPFKKEEKSLNLLIIQTGIIQQGQTERLITIAHRYFGEFPLLFYFLLFSKGYERTPYFLRK